MRVPLYFSIPSCLIVAAGVWYLGTKDEDFTAPPTPERLAEVAIEWEKSRPNTPPPKPINAALLADPTPIKPKSSATAKQEEEIIPAGDLNLAPSLSEYGTYGDKGAAAMIHLATQLETKAQFQRALLAWERVIDTSNPDEKERLQAVRAIQRIRGSLPPWNPDPSADISLTLHAGATIQDKAVLENALKMAAALIDNASGNVVKVDTQATIGKGSGIKTPRIPIAIWFTRPSSTSEGATAETPPISFMADPKQPELLASQVAAGVYALIRNHLSTETSFSPLPEYPAGVQPDDLLQFYVTRLMWREFVKSMKE
ncbi:hypothetical protein JO972_02245 [Verrucomicrobiaceae bacterium 5K15]|uniref:Uncharacterized protein n=1 Tax=Oceaniferula flava TaxID=2800421 RepID=A0AAE2VBH4_9BACT|nr:hypothetical protein [Oceaniferula flavus]MBK1853766.1 hypothetical protein [Oceaniferula flavus]MBM1135073.1 hypothetical protein [Oceaniferula flavus]